MPIKSRPDPVIPDHEMLRKIGGGAYGEVWLGRGVTGALRAVKVVWREDFDDERTFEREFEGILKFEPISRDHPGLVNILHVGRDTVGGEFYYYVMELGDDIRNGREINPIEYEPRTLRPDVKTTAVVRMDLAECVDVGLRLAEALHHLHEAGLAHRDVKPSNVIFVNGRAKLADIGLVATRGQRTFVGTEGFVPPEGPGSTQADVYSLGKVLYEIATGKDRLDFPELPEDLPMGAERKRWLGLNRIVCEVCEPRVSKRRITTAAELADALRLLQKGQKRRRSMAGAVWVTSAMLSGFAAWVGWETLRDSSWFVAKPPPPPPPPLVGPEVPAVGRVLVVTLPGSADVLDEAGQYLGTTPTTLEARVGDELDLRIQKSGYRTEEMRVTVEDSAVEESQTMYVELEVFRPPDIGDAWLDHLGKSYQPVTEEHLGFGLVEEAEWKQFLEETKTPADVAEIVSISQNGEPSRVVVCSMANAELYCAWLRAGAVRAGYLTEDHEMVPVMESSFDAPDLSERARSEGFKPFRVRARMVDYASIVLTTDPPGADVYVNGPLVGVADGSLVVGKIPPGVTGVIVVKEGFKSHVATLNMKPGEKLSLAVKLEPSHGVEFGKPWENGLGMRFQPLGEELMGSVWETRVADYALFVKETGGAPPPPPPGGVPGPNHPVVFVSRNDAEKFCKWLTERERRPGEERIQEYHQYRLPTDLEWSAMAGLDESPGLSPSWRDVHKAEVFPWGGAWPPPERSANLADTTAVDAGGLAPERTIPGYTDGFAAAAPVGSFPANALGFFDLAGNILEWVADDNSLVDPFKLGVLRGGSWTGYRREHLFTGARYPQSPEAIADDCGFRVVLARVSMRPEATAPAVDAPVIVAPAVDAPVIDAPDS